MAKDEIDLQRLGAEVARGFDHFVSQRASAVQQARWGFMANAPGSARAPLLLRPSVAFGALALVVVLSVGLFWGVHARVRPLTFKVDGADGAVQSWLAAQSARPVQLEFSDGSAFRLAQSARARVVAVARDGAQLSLESGSLHAEVVHTGSSHWELISGPLTVRVTGTRFDLSWNPVSQLFSIHVLEGSVVVSGGPTGLERPVRGGERLLVSIPEQRFELTRRALEPSLESAHGAEADGSPALPPPVPPVDDWGSARPSRVAPEPAAPPAKKAERSGWRELAARGALREAFAAAEADGFNQACLSASAAELLLLGDAARLAGRPERVNEALLSLRQRYPSDSRRAAAAFMLGKVAFDQRHAYAQAASWFATCIREQPAGSLAREASGRLIEALQAAGDLAGARKAAEAYLIRYPRGPHAPLAQSLRP